MFLLLKIVYFGWDLGFFDDFRKSFVNEYLNYFCVVGSKCIFDFEGFKLEFVRWSVCLVFIEVELKVKEFGCGECFVFCFKYCWFGCVVYVILSINFNLFFWYLFFIIFLYL